MTLADVASIVAWPYVLAAGAVGAGLRWVVCRRRPAQLRLTEEQRLRVVANHERERQESHR